MSGEGTRGSDYGANKSKGLAKVGPFTESASPQYLYGTPEEVKQRLEGGTANTESSFSQIKPSRRSARGGSIAERAPGEVVRNGKMGRSERHSGD
jgi:hypothetical protein